LSTGVGAIVEVIGDEDGWRRLMLLALEFAVRVSVIYESIGRLRG
jgi:hypothetical protein